MVESPVMALQKEVLRKFGPPSSLRKGSSSPDNASSIGIKSRSRQASLVALPAYQVLETDNGNDAVNNHLHMIALQENDVTQNLLSSSVSDPDTPPRDVVMPPDFVGQDRNNNRHENNNFPRNVLMSDTEAEASV